MRFVIDEHQSSVMALIFISVITDVKVWELHQTLQWWIWKLIYVYGEPFDFAWFIFVSKSAVNRVDIPLSQAWFFLFKYKKKNFLNSKLVWTFIWCYQLRQEPGYCLVFWSSGGPRSLSFWGGFVRHGFSRHFWTDSVSRNTDTCSPDFPHACFRHVQTSLAWV